MGLASLTTATMPQEISGKADYEPFVFENEEKRPQKAVSVIVIGAGSRGWGAYSSYGLKFPDEMKVVGVAEPIPYRRERISKAFGIPPENQFIT